MSPWIGNISADPKLTINNFSYHQTESPSISVKSSLSSLRLSYPNFVFTPLNTNSFTGYGPTFTLVIKYLQGSVRRFSRLHDSKFCAMDESNNKSIMQFTGAGYKDWRTKMEYGLPQKRLINIVQAWRGKPRLVRPMPITLMA